MQGLRKAAGRPAKRVVRVAETVQRQLKRDDALGAGPQDCFHAIADQLGKEAVRGKQHDRGPVIAVENVRDLGKIASQENLAPGEGQPQEAAEGSGNLFDLRQ